jgi:hypothetical protein
MCTRVFVLLFLRLKGGRLRDVSAEIRRSQRRRFQESARHDAAPGIVLLSVIVYSREFTY